MQSEPTARGMPDHDPAASGAPRIPLPHSADLPEVVRERYDLAGEYERGAYDALRQVLAVLDRGDRMPELVGTLRALEYHGPADVHAILRSLEAFARPGGAVEEGERR